MISKSFLKSSFIYTVVGSLPLASSILLLPFYGNSSLLSTSDFGLLAIYIILSELARVLFTFSADNFLGINFIHHNTSKENIQKFIGTSAVFLLIYGFGVTLLFSFLGDFIFDFAYPGKTIHYLPFGLLSALTGLFNGIFKAYSTLMIYREKPTPFFWSNIFNFIVTVLISVSGLYLFPQSLIGPIWGRFISAFAVFVWAIIYFYSESKFKFDKTILKRLLDYSAPLYIYSILYWIVSNIDRYFILGILSEKEVAIFDFAIKMTLVIEFLQNGLSSAITPKVFKIWKNNNDEPKGNIDINKYFHVFALINIACLPLLYISIPLIVPHIINNSDLYSSFNLLPILFAGMISRIWYYYLITPVFYFKKTRILPIVFTFTAIFQIVCTFFLIKEDGINGAVWANFFTKLVQVALLFLFVRKFYSFFVNYKKFILYPIIYMLILIIYEVFFKQINIYYINIAHISVLAVFGYVFFRNEIQIKQIVKIFNKN
ncbi:MAG: lipopolysaccharide biosynthesis protein [Bacteroidales bacterium]